MYARYYKNLLSKNVLTTVSLITYAIHKKITENIVKTAYYTILPVFSYLTPSNLPTLNNTPPKSHCFLYMIILQILSPINKYPAFAFSISLPTSTPLTTLSYSIVFIFGSALLNYPCNDLPLIYHPAPQPFSISLHLSLLNLSFRCATRLRSWPYPF